MEDVELRGCGQSFSGYPMTDLTFRNNTSANPLCPSENDSNRSIDMAKFYTAGDNSVNGVYGENITVEEGYYYNPCPSDEMQYYWEARKGEIYANEGPELIELDQWEPKQTYRNNFAWETCGFKPPTTDCSEFPE